MNEPAIIRAVPLLVLLLLACACVREVPVDTEATDNIIASLKEYIAAGLNGEPEFLVCDTQWPESACIGVEVGGLMFSGMNRETNRAFAIIIEYRDMFANVHTCQFEWLAPETISCDTSMPDKETAKLSLGYVLATKWPKLGDQLTSSVPLERRANVPAW